MSIQGILLLLRGRILDRQSATPRASGDSGSADWNDASHAGTTKPGVRKLAADTTRAERKVSLLPERSGAAK